MAKKKLLIAAVIVGLFAAALLYLYASEISRQNDHLMRGQVEVVKAARNIPAGTPLTRDRITTDLVPERFLPPNPLLEADLEIYVGSPLSVNVEEGAMVLTSDFAVEERVNNLASKVPAGERAFTVPVDSVSGVAGLLEPGDRVDILGTFPMGGKDQLVPDERGKESVGYSTLTVLQAVTVLAVGSKLSSIHHDQRGPSYSTITVSVTIGEAEMLTLLQTRGKLHHVLRNRNDMDLATGKPLALRDVLSRLKLMQEHRTERVVKRAREDEIDVIYGDRPTKSRAK